MAKKREWYFGTVHSAGDTTINRFGARREGSMESNGAVPPHARSVKPQAPARMSAALYKCGTEGQARNPSQRGETFKGNA